VQPLFLPPATPTRTAGSFADEGETRFSAGDVNGAIRAYQNSVELEPLNSALWAELSRIQTYSSALLTTTQQRRDRLAEARESAERAAEVDPENSTAHAIRALSYDWSASAEESTLRDTYLAEAESAAVRAQQLDPENALALAVFAEVLVDQQRYAQAVDFAGEAVSRAPDSMDVHRVYGTVLESNGLYRQAIEEYRKAAEIAPNFTFLYLRIGANYRRLRNIDLALEYFERAARINEQLGILDPIPYLAIGRTYLQDGEFFIAARNIESALSIDPTNAGIYGQLGIVYFKARNYESAIPVLQCAVDGCPAAVSAAILCEFAFDCEDEESPPGEDGFEVVGLPLDSSSLEYYYTYGSVLAAYGDTEAFPRACLDAERIFQKLMESYGQDPVVPGIVEDGRALCGGEAPRIEPTATPST
jgi:tetratricopeptide (TPR) repeat protein